MLSQRFLYSRNPLRSAGVVQTPFEFVTGGRAMIKVPFDRFDSLGLCRAKARTF
jgi:hypothetical protein